MGSQRVIIVDQSGHSRACTTNWKPRYLNRPMTVHGLPNSWMSLSYIRTIFRNRSSEKSHIHICLHVFATTTTSQDTVYKNPTLGVKTEPVMCLCQLYRVCARKPDIYHYISSLHDQLRFYAEILINFGTVHAIQLFLSYFEWIVRSSPTKER